jgi:enolase-phosphatase E1
MTREIKVTLSDIEGTTTPISFVHDTLFPYAREHIQSYLERHYPSDSDVVACARLIESEAALIGQVTDSIEEQRKHIIACVEKLMQLDRKTPGLKRLQGRVWTEGYQSGEIKGR